MTFVRKLPFGVSFDRYNYPPLLISTWSRRWRGKRWTLYVQVDRQVEG